MSADITVTVSSTRLFPSSQTSPPRVVPLSILDCSVGNFSPTGATWVFDAPSSLVAIDVGPAEHLELSLVETLGAYPQWAGQLRYTAYSPSAAERDHTLRSRRLEIAYGNGAGVDPGVAFVVARCASRVADVFPSLEKRVCGSGAFDATALNAEALGLFPTTLTLSNGDAESTAAGLPCLIAQITTFACGGVAIALKAAHPMADAQTLVAFVDDWAAVSRSLLYGASLPVLAPVFDPAAIDRTAAGDIDAPQPDAGVLAVARELPIHRYDWWARADGEGGLDEKRIPAHLRGAALHPGRPLPWHEWDLTLPIKSYLLYFSKGEVDRIWGAATAEDLPAEHRISRLDALQAHIWQVLMRAYPAADEGEEFYMNLSLGMRTRVAPPLPFNALGSPILLARYRWLYEVAGIMHRDISLNNVMFRREPKDGKVHAVLNDFDLAVYWKDSSLSSTSKQRTGTKPFMACELLVVDGDPPAHVYRFDLESLLYVMVFAMYHYHDGKEIDNPPYRDWTRLGTVALLEKKRIFLQDPEDLPDLTANFVSLKPLIQGIFDLFSLYFTRRRAPRRAKLALDMSGLGKPVDFDMVDAESQKHVPTSPASNS